MRTRNTDKISWKTSRQNSVQANEIDVELGFKRLFGAFVQVGLNLLCIWFAGTSTIAFNVHSTSAAVVHTAQVPFDFLILCFLLVSVCVSHTPIIHSDSLNARAHAYNHTCFLLYSDKKLHQITSIQFGYLLFARAALLTNRLKKFRYY